MKLIPDAEKESKQEKKGMKWRTSFLLPDFGQLFNIHTNPTVSHITEYFSLFLALPVSEEKEEREKQEAVSTKMRPFE